MSEKQTPLLRFFGKKSVPFQESDVEDKGPTTSKKRKASFIGGHESTAILLLGTFELSNLIVIKKLLLKFFFYFYF